MRATSWTERQSLRREARLLWLFAAVAAAWPLALHVAGFAAGLLHLAPMLLLLLLLTRGRFPGEQLLARAWARRAPRRTPPLTPGRSRRPHILMPHGGELIATGLAGRAPPHGRAARAGGAPVRSTLQRKRGCRCDASPSRWWPADCWLCPLPPRRTSP